MVERDTLISFESNEENGNSSSYEIFLFLLLKLKTSWILHWVTLLVQIQLSKNGLLILKEEAHSGHPAEMVIPEVVEKIHKMI